MGGQKGLPAPKSRKSEKKGGRGACIVGVLEVRMIISEKGGKETYESNRVRQTMSLESSASRERGEG